MGQEQRYYMLCNDIDMHSSCFLQYAACCDVSGCTVIALHAVQSQWVECNPLCAVPELNNRIQLCFRARAA